MLKENYTNDIVFILYTLSISLGGVFYMFIGFDYIDELLTLILFTTLLISKKFRIYKELIFLFICFIGYLIYSLIIKVTIPSAIFHDFQQEIKPYLVFYCALALKGSFTNSQKRLLKLLILSLVLFIIIIIVTDNIDDFFTHPTFMATSCLTLGLTYLYISDFNKRDIFIFVFIIIWGLFSMRGKFLGEIVGIFFIIFFINKEIKLSLKNVIVMSLMLVLVILISWHKIQIYFFPDEGETARLALYYNSINIFYDYFPLGSGFGTYGNDASRVYYSPLYYEYGLNFIWGLNHENDSYVTDTYFPILCQYGVVGLLLFSLFWLKIYSRIKKTFRLNKIKFYKISLCLFLIIVIESVADSTILSYRGISLMMLLGFTLAHNKKEQSQYNNVE